MTDHSLSDQSLYGSDRWCALVLGRSVEWFRNKRNDLESDGFPLRDRLTGMTIKADVYAWVNRRRRITDEVKVVSLTETTGVNHDAF